MRPSSAVLHGGGSVMHGSMPNPRSTTCKMHGRQQRFRTCSRTCLRGSALSLTREESASPSPLPQSSPNIPAIVYRASQHTYITYITSMPCHAELCSAVGCRGSICTRSVCCGRNQATRTSKACSESARSWWRSLEPKAHQAARVGSLLAS
jgi:hypothetical protein